MTDTFNLKPSEQIAVAIGQWEGGQGAGGLFHPYWDSYGRVWTIGFGHTGSDVGSHSKPLTLAQAEALLRTDLAKTYAPPIVALHRVGKQKQFDALLSFVYNVGTGMLESSHTIGAALQNREFKQAADALLLYDHSGSTELEGLKLRREWERQLFLGGTYKVSH